MKDCLFCKIVQGQIPCTQVYEDQKYFAFKDIHPQAKTHILIVPKEHYSDLNHVFSNAQDASALLGGLSLTAVKIAEQLELKPAGYRTVINTGQNGGQTVFHLHLHLLGGEPLSGRFA